MTGDRSHLSRRRALQTLGIALTTGCLRASTGDSTESPGESSPLTGTLTATRDGTSESPEGTPTAEPEDSPSDSEGPLDPSGLSKGWTDETGLTYKYPGVAGGEMVLTQLEDQETVVARSLADGSGRWRAPFATDIWIQPRILQSSVLVGSTDTLAALSLSDGSERWRYETSGKLRVQPVVARDQGLLVVPVVLGDYESGRIDGLSLDSGDRVWQFDTSTEANSLSPVVDGTVYAGYNREIRGYSVDDGTPMPDDEQPVAVDGANISGFPHERLLFAHAGTLYFPVLGGNNRIVAYDPEADEVLWQYEPFGQVLTFDAWGETLAFGADDNAVYGLDRSTGTRRWRVQRDAPFVHIAADRGVVWALQDDSETLLGIDAADGTVHVEQELPFAVDDFSVVGRTVVLFGQLGTAAYRIES
jgi:outer membrane protein assembly factor BamB